MHTQYDEGDIKRMMERLVARIAAVFPPDAFLGIVGIRTRGQIVAQRIAAMLAQKGFTHIGTGVLDITFYRDDVRHAGAKPLIQPTEINFDLNGKPALLVDDVISTGRSIRAALDALTDFGRPSLIRLAVLVDRGGREIPVQPDFTGVTLKEVPADHRVNVRMTETDGRDEIVVEPRT